MSSFAWLMFFVIFSAFEASVSLAEAVVLCFELSSACFFAV
jgi:hypothetical protein